MSEPRPNVAEFTVSEIAFAVKRTIEDAYGFVRVRGEISGYRGPHSSGHAYFSLKDDKARIEAVVWRGSFQRLRFKPEEGMEVVATGKLTTFPGGSKYQIVIETLEPAGVGALMALLEERRGKLAAEGLFDEARKQLLPYLPRVIGVVTSPTGAVIRDILHRLADRFPVRVLVWPVRVQGETSAAEVAAAIAGFNALAPGGPIPRPDLLIVARGGGSLEDLWGFNEEVVVRAAAASDIPLVSAVGHETDWTLIDHAADRRAPTPTGAAEMAVPVRSELIATVDDLARRLTACALRGLDGRRTALRAAARALRRPADLLAPARQRLDLAGARLDHALAAATRGHRGRFEKVAGRLSPAGLSRLIAHSRDRAGRAAGRADRLVGILVARRGERLAGLALRLRPERSAARIVEARLRLDSAAGRLDRCVAATVERHRNALQAAAKLLASLGYEGVLARGFALARDGEGHLIRSVAGVPAAAPFRLAFADGEVGVRRADADAPAAPASDPRREPSARPKRGGSRSIASEPASPNPAPPAPAEPETAATPVVAPRRPKRSPGDQGSLF